MKDSTLQSRKYGEQWNKQAVAADRDLYNYTLLLDALWNRTRVGVPIYTMLSNIFSTLNILR